MLAPLVKALASQLAGLVLTFSLARNGTLPPLDLFWLACVQGGFAAIVSALLVAPRWWLFIHLAFLPIVVLATYLHLPIEVYATGFVVLALTYWSSFRTQVPLFLSNRTTVHRLACWIPDRAGLRILDAGSGTGSFVRRLARLRPDWAVIGIETAPAPYLLSRWRARSLPNLRVDRSNFWQHSLAGYDIVYAFLSPVPMPDLWRKARLEMSADSLLISNSFAIPNARPEIILDIGDRRQTKLFIYRMPGRKSRD